MTGDDLELVLAVEGSLQGLAHYPLAEPDGISLQLPSAHATLAPGTYTIGRGDVTQIWVREPTPAGQQIRIFLRRQDLRGDGPHVAHQRDGADRLGEPVRALVVVVFQRDAPLVAKEVQVTVRSAHGHLELARQVGGPYGLAAA